MNRYSELSDADLRKEIIRRFDGRSYMNWVTDVNDALTLIQSYCKIETGKKAGVIIWRCTFLLGNTGWCSAATLSRAICEAWLIQNDALQAVQDDMRKLRGGEKI